MYVIVLSGRFRFAATFNFTPSPCWTDRNTHRVARLQKIRKKVRVDEIR